MGRPRNDIRKTIRLGKPGDPARVLVERYIEIHGEQAFSKLMRQLIVMYLSNKPEFKHTRKKMLAYELKNTGKKIQGLCKERDQIKEKLEKIGIDPNDIKL